MKFGYMIRVLLIASRKKWVFIVCFLVFGFNIEATVGMSEAKEDTQFFFLLWERIKQTVIQILGNKRFTYISQNISNLFLE